MAKFLIGVLTGGILTILVVVLIAFSLARLKDRTPQVEGNSVLYLRLSGDIPERVAVDYPIPFLKQSDILTVTDIWGILRKAAVDSRIKAIILEPESVSIGWGKMQELRADIEQFKKSGKPVYAFLRTPSAREYYIAAAANRIYMEPQDYLMLKGARFEVMYFRGTLDKLGVTVDVEHDGKYKDFGDMFTRTNMSPETKEVLTSMLDGLYGELVEGIANGRKKSPDEIRATIDNGPFLSDQAVKAGLVDRLRFEDEVFGDLKTDLKQNDLKKVTDHVYSKTPFSSVGLGGKQRVALIVAEGDITRGDADSDGTDGIESTYLDKVLRQVGNDASVKAAIVRIDSPGGEVTASDELWREMNQLSKKKPIVISMSDYAASGGYYMAMTGDPILAYNGTVTGSIGVVFGKPNLHGLYDKLGITKDEISRGRFADIDSDYQPLSDAARAKLKDGIDVEYRDFINKVAAGRHRQFEDIEPIAQGRAWLGSQAKGNGLVDEIGGIDRAIEMVKKKANIAPGENINLVTYPPRRSIFDLLMQKQTQDADVEVRLAKYLGVKTPGLRPWLHGGMLEVLPFRLDWK
ncbi:MAG TPA: signal peptide peptidase SppA [Bryobacteraceae bacterium]